MSLSALFALPLVLGAAKPAPSFVPPNRPYAVSHYRIDFRLHEDGTFDNTVAVTVKPKKATGAIELDSYGLSIHSAKVAGQPATFSLKEDASARTGLLTVRAAKPLAAGKEAVIQIAYSGKAIQGGHEGLFSVRDDEHPDLLPFFFTHFEPMFARRFFPSDDQPADKATTEVFSIVDSRYQVFSNGKKVLDETFTDGDQHLRRVDWVQDKPHPTYAVAVAVGQFDDVDVASEVPAQIHVPKGKGSLAFIASDATQSALTSEADFVKTKYPWAKYDQVAVPHFYFGGMENTSLVLAREKWLALDDKNDFYDRTGQVSLIAHELAHQWFGDLVTCKWWDDTWLNEGFATYLATRAFETYFQNDEARVYTAEQTFVDYFREDDGPRAHPLVSRAEPSPDDAFDRTSYVKGAHVLQMLEHWVGKDELRKALAAYLEEHAYGNATSTDFFAAVGKSTRKEKELKPFEDAWLHKKGYPVVRVSGRWEDGTESVTITQRPNHPDEKGPFVFELPIVFHRSGETGYEKALTVRVDKPEVKAKLDLPAAPQWVNWNQDGTALVRFEPSSISEEQWIAGAREDPDPVWRLLAQYQLLGELVDPEAKELVRPSDAALDAILHGLTDDPSPYVREALLERLAMGRFRLPKELGPVVLELAKLPKNLPEDPLGIVRVRFAALSLLGKIDDPDAQKYVLDGLLEKDININYLQGLAIGVARVGTTAAVATVRAALEQQKARGYPYYRRVLPAVGATENPEVIPVLAQVLKDNPGNDEVARAVTDPLRDNYVVKTSPEFAAFVRDLVLSNKDFGDDLKSRYIQILEEVKTSPVRDALTQIAAQAPSVRLQGEARNILEKNFGKAPTAPGGARSESR